MKGDFMRKFKLIFLSILCSFLLITPLSEPIQAKSNDPETIIKSYNNAGILDTSKINKEIKIEDETFYTLIDSVNYFVAVDEEGNVENYFNINGTVYKQNASGRITLVGAVSPGEAITLPGVLSLNPRATDNWNATVTYKKRVDLTTQDTTEGTVLALLSLATDIDITNASMSFLSLVVTWHNAFPAEREYMYVKYNQVSWVGCPIFIKTWNIYNYKNSNYTGLISSDTTVRKTWRNNPMLNQYRVACATPASMYW